MEILMSLNKYFLATLLLLSPFASYSVYPNYLKEIKENKFVATAVAAGVTGYLFMAKQAITEAEKALGRSMSPIERLSYGAFIILGMGTLSITLGELAGTSR